MFITLTFDSELIYLPILRKAIRAICSHLTEKNECLDEIELAVHEALSNVIYHAYKNEAGHPVTVIIGLMNGDITIEIRDHGITSLMPFSPLALEYDIFNIEELRESGRGLFFIHQLMDEVSYKRQLGENSLLLRKHIK